MHLQNDYKLTQFLKYWQPVVKYTLLKKTHLYYATRLQFTHC